MPVKVKNVIYSGKRSIFRYIFDECLYNRTLFYVVQIDTTSGKKACTA